MTDIFVSYSRKDREIVRHLIPILEAQGWSVFWDPSIEPGQRWDELIATTLHEARCVVVCWSQNSVLSSWVKDEAGSGRDRDALVPVSIDGTLAPLGFRQIQTAFLNPESGGMTGAALDQFLAAIRRLLGASAADDEYLSPRAASNVVFDFTGPGTAGGFHLEVDPDGTFTIDLINECGDSFESSYAIACLATADIPNLHAQGVPQPGSMLVLGANDPHPRPSLDRYETALVKPFAAAHPDNSDRKPLFVAPGFHRSDEGLAHFESLFSTARSRAARGIGLSFGGWQTYQSDTFFALGLPHNWWIWGVDVRYGEPLAPKQFNYFSLVSERLSADARVILFVPQENWLLADFDEWREQANLQRLLALVEEKGARIAAIVSGGRREYARYEVTANGTQMFEVGGGRAFVSPTHGAASETAVQWRAPVRQDPSQPVAVSTHDTAPISLPPLRDRSEYEKTLENWHLDKLARGGPIRYLRYGLASLISWGQSTEEQRDQNARCANRHIGTLPVLLRGLFPAQLKSRGKALLNLWFTGYNPGVGLGIGLLYWLIASRFFALAEQHNISNGQIDAVMPDSYWGLLAYFPLYFTQAGLVSFELFFVIAGLLLFCIWHPSVSGTRTLAQRLLSGALGTIHFLTHAFAIAAFGLFFILLHNELTPTLKMHIDQLWTSRESKPAVVRDVISETLEPFHRRGAEQRQIIDREADALRTDRPMTLPGDQPLPPLSPITEIVDAPGESGIAYKEIRQVVGFLFFPLEMVFVGAFVGGTIYGIFLTLIGLVGGRFAEAAFAAFRPKGYRTFLRMKFGPDSAVVYPIGLKRIPKRKQWHTPYSIESNGKSAPELRPSKPLRPQLVEPPIEIR